MDTDVFKNIVGAVKIYLAALFLRAILSICMELAILVAVVVLLALKFFSKIQN